MSGVDKLSSISMMMIVVGLIAQLGAINRVAGQTIGEGDMLSQSKLKVTVGEPIVMASALGPRVALVGMGWQL